MLRKQFIPLFQTVGQHISLLRGRSVYALALMLMFAPLSQAQESYLGGDWRCNLNKVSLYTTGNKNIKIDHSTSAILLMGESGSKSTARFSAPFILSTPGWEYGNLARLGINIDGTFYFAEDVLEKGLVKQGFSGWNFLQWEGGMICSTSATALAAGREALRKASP